MSDSGEAKADTLEAQASLLLKDCCSLYSYLESNLVGESPKAKEGERPSLTNPIDESISLIQDARKVIGDTRAVLESSVISKLR